MTPFDSTSTICHQERMLGEVYTGPFCAIFATSCYSKLFLKILKLWNKNTLYSSKKK